MVPYYEDGSVTIYHGDALEVMGDLGPRIADIVVTSPPYNMGLSPSGDGKSPAVVLDPSMGSGTTLVAAKRAGVKASD